MIEAALQKIENDLLALAKEAETDPIDSYRLSVIARQIAAQREMMERGLVG